MCSLVINYIFLIDYTLIFFFLAQMYFSLFFQCVVNFFYNDYLLIWTYEKVYLPLPLSNVWPCSKNL
jgi:hypothetical protein